MSNTSSSRGYLFERGREYFARNLDSLLKDFDGSYVAILEDSVIDSDAEFSELAARVYGRYGYREIFMPRVQEGPELVSIDSPSFTTQAVTRITRERS